MIKKCMTTDRRPRKVCFVFHIKWKRSSVVIPYMRKNFFPNTSQGVWRTFVVVLDTMCHRITLCNAVRMIRRMHSPGSRGVVLCLCFVGCSFCVLIIVSVITSNIARMVEVLIL